MIPFRTRLAGALITGLIAQSAAAQCLPQFRTGQWQGFPGTNGLVQSMTVADPDGAGPIPNSLVIGGTFTVVGEARAVSTAYWNAATGWVGMGRYTGSAENVWALTAWNGRIIAGGGFGTLNPSTGNGSVAEQPSNLAIWDSTAGVGATGAWLPMSATQLSVQIQALVDFNGTLYAAARSSTPPSSFALYRYTPGPTQSTGTWSGLPSDVSGSATGFAVFNNELYITGRFSRAATPSVYFQVAKLNAAGTDLIPLPSLSASSTANGAIAFNGSLYAYGAFSGAPLPAGTAKIVKLSADGTAWLSSTTDATNTAIASISGINSALVYNNELIVGTATSATPLAVLSSNNGQWTFPSVTGPITGGNTINTLCPLPDGTQIAVGGSGDFGQFANTSATRLAFWNRSTNTYSPPAKGLGDVGLGYTIVYAAAEFAGNLYLAGELRGIGESKGSLIAKWNGSALTPVAGTPAISAPQWMFGDNSGGALYLGGGSLLLNRFDGVSFSTVTDSNPAGYATGIFGVSSAANYNGDLVVGGSFQRSGYINYLMRRSGTTWARFGAADPNGSVTALTTWSSPSIAGGAPLLVASGQFTTIGSLTARVAAWDGTTWRALGQSSFAGYSANGAVSLLVLNGDLYQLAYMNGLNNSNAYPVLIRYNPATDTWSEIPKPPASIASGFGTPARGVVLNGAIWIASTYTLPGTSDPIGVLRWDGLEWSAYGGIAGGFPQSYDITAYNGDVVLVGGFASVGTQPQAGGGTTRGRFSNGWARLSTGGTPPVVAAQPLPAAACPGTSVSFTASGNGQPPLGYRWQRVDDNGIGTDLTDGPIPGIPATAANSGTSTLTLSAIGTGADRLRLRCIVSNDCGSAASIPVRLFVSPADVGAAGGVPGRDGLYDNNDFIAFINYFFNTDTLADIGRAGGVLGEDGLFDNNDFIVFINQFFGGC